MLFRSFLTERLPFVGISEVVGRVLNSHERVELRSFDEVDAVDAAARREAELAVEQVAVGV